MVIFSQYSSSLRFKALDGDGCLFEHNGRLVMTDESLMLEEGGDGTLEHPIGGPRWVGDSFAELEDWLMRCAADWWGEGMDSPMVQEEDESMETIVIKVWLGMVSEVYATSKDIDVVVIDEDVPETEQLDVELPEHRVY